MVPKRAIPAKQRQVSGKIELGMESYPVPFPQHLSTQIAEISRNEVMNSTLHGKRTRKASPVLGCAVWGCLG